MATLKGRNFLTLMDFTPDEIRHFIDLAAKFKKMKKEGEITEDDQKDLENEAQKLTDKFCKNIDSLVAEKEKEIMSI